MDLAGVSVVVTGGRSGLGAACVQRFQAEGAHVVIADVAIRAEQLPERVRFVAADVTQTEDVEHVLATAAGLGPLRVVVNCAGVIHAQRVVGREHPYDLDQFRRVIEVYLIGTFNVMRLAAAQMSHQSPCGEGERGVIINTSSVAAFEGQIGQSAYAASKGGVASMTLPAARELAQHGIRVCAIAPGVFDTPMMQSMSDQVRESLAAQVPFPPRLGDPVEFASLALHLVQNRMCNGAVFRLDGAARLP